VPVAGDSAGEAVGHLGTITGGSDRGGVRWAWRYRPQNFLSLRRRLGSCGERVQSDVETADEVGDHDAHDGDERPRMTTSPIAMTVDGVDVPLEVFARSATLAAFHEAGHAVAALAWGLTVTVCEVHRAQVGR
jgi:hypothetical protein